MNRLLTIHMKYQALFSLIKQNNKNIRISSATILLIAFRVNLTYLLILPYSGVCVVFKADIKMEIWAIKKTDVYGDKCDFRYDFKIKKKWQ